MKVFEKIKVTLKDKTTIRIFKFLNIPIFRTDKNKNKNRIFFFKSIDTNYTNKNLFFYLKVNLNNKYSMKALQQWIDIVNCMNADFIIVCDSNKLKNSILKNIKFYDENIKFTKSLRKPLKNIVKNIVTGFWANAAYAHMTTFFHAQKHDIKEFWNIDADDTIILAEPSKVSEILHSAQIYAQTNNVSLFSFDMWRSRTRSKAWTFGITYTRNVNNFIKNFKNANKSWQKDYIDVDQALNIDWYCTFLKNTGFAKIETFFVENCGFIHLGDCIFDPVGKFICFFKENTVCYPILIDLYKNNSLGKILISDDCIKINSDIEIIDGLKVLEKLLVYNDLNFPQKLKTLWKIED